MSLLTLLGMIVVAAPAVLVAGLGLPALFGLRPSERVTSGSVRVAIIVGFVAAASVLAGMLVSDDRHVAINLGDWISIAHYHFSVKFVFDRLSVPFVLLSYALCGTISAFADRYMHRESGFYRFFLLLAVFLLGMIVASLAGTVETLFAGWEFVGLSSALLVAFFHDRPAPVRNGLRIWCVYRVSDAALLLAALLLHHMTGEGDFDKLMGTAAGPWPLGDALISPQQALVVGTLLLIAAAGKSALLPFSGWLPRAMEGPTPSSAIFYGALSVHLGAFLLLRVGPLLDESLWLRVAVVTLGLSTAVTAAVITRVQTDIKSALSFACLTQVGIIVVEIGLGFRYLALIHILGHASLRTLQFVRAPTLLQDYRVLENHLGTRLPQTTGSGVRFVPAAMRPWLYRFALERGYFDTFLDRFVVRPFVRSFLWFDRLERRWTKTLSRGAADDANLGTVPVERLEELI